MNHFILNSNVMWVNTRVDFWILFRMKIKIRI